MAKLGAIMDRGPIPLKVEGVFIKNIPAKQIDEKFGDLEERMKTDPEKVVEELFQTLICDADGNQFEDTGSFDEITGALSVAAINEIVNAIPKALMPTVEDAEK